MRRIPRTTWVALLCIPALLASGCNDPKDQQIAALQDENARLTGELQSAQLAADANQQDADEARQRLDDAIAAGAGRVYVLGGDGTVLAVAGIVAAVACAMWSGPWTEPGPDAGVPALAAPQAATVERAPAPALRPGPGPAQRATEPNRTSTEGQCPDTGSVPARRVT